MERFQPSEYIVVAPEVNSVHTQVYKGEDRSTLQAILPAAKVMLNDFNCSCLFYIACGYEDLYRGIDGLGNLLNTRF